MRRNFFICGLTGWCLEILFTSIGNCSRHDLRLIGADFRLDVSHLRHGMYHQTAVQIL